MCDIRACEEQSNGTIEVHGVIICFRPNGLMMDTSIGRDMIQYLTAEETVKALMSDPRLYLIF